MLIEKKPVGRQIDVGARPLLAERNASEESVDNAPAQRQGSLTTYVFLSSNQSADLRPICSYMDAENA